MGSSIKTFAYEGGGWGGDYLSETKCDNGGVVSKEMCSSHFHNFFYKFFQSLTVLNFFHDGKMSSLRSPIYC